MGPGPDLVNGLEGSVRPADAVAGHGATGPEVPLPSTGHQVHGELSLARVVERDGRHADAAAVAVSGLTAEAGAT